MGEGVGQSGNCHRLGEALLAEKDSRANLARRWVVERTFSWLGQNRRMSLGTMRGCPRPERSIHLRGDEPPYGETFGSQMRLFR
jgi:hypothetical protein